MTIFGAYVEKERIKGKKLAKDYMNAMLRTALKEKKRRQNKTKAVTSKINDDLVMIEKTR